MSEKFNTNNIEEELISPEAVKIDRHAVISALNEQTPESERMLLSYLMQLESSVGDSIEEKIGYIRDTAKIYKEAGLFERAFNALNDAADMAYYEGHDDLCAEIDKEMDEISS
jgi:hypothetical protein